MKFCVLASGSKGNSIWVETDAGAVIIDSGISGKELLRRMNQAKLDPARLTAIIVTHEHRDHVSGVGVAARKWRLPVYINPDTLKEARPLLAKLHVRTFKTGHDFEINDMVIHPFSVSHDAADTVGFTFDHNGSRLGLATDLGQATKLVTQHLSGCQGLILEANHDFTMLMEGPYPPFLKQRVRGRTGHLSNDDSAELLARVAHSRLKHVVLAHLSETNNLPALAMEKAGSAVSNPPFTLITAAQGEAGPVREI